MMNAMVLFGQRQRLRRTKLPVPQPATGQVLVKISAAVDRLRFRHAFVDVRQDEGRRSLNGFGFCGNCWCGHKFVVVR